MKTFTVVIIVLLLLSIAGNVWQWTVARNNFSTRLAENKRLQDTITVNKTRALDAVAAVKRLEAERMEMRDSAKVAQNASKARLRANLDTINSLKKKLAPKLKENPDINELVTAQDLAYSRLDSLYKSTELAHSAEIVNLESQLEEKGKEAMAERLQKEAWREAAENAEKDVTRANKKVTFWKVVSAVASGVIAVLLLKP